MWWRGDPLRRFCLKDGNNIVIVYQGEVYATIDNIATKEITIEAVRHTRKTFTLEE